jgi:hypothetical protein
MSKFFFLQDSYKERRAVYELLPKSLTSLRVYDAIPMKSVLDFKHLLLNKNIHVPKLGYLMIEYLDKI